MPPATNNDPYPRRSPRLNSHQAGSGGSGVARSLERNSTETETKTETTRNRGKGTQQHNLIQGFAHWVPMSIQGGIAAM